tara:strand:- start:196 stop:663 length:468 start_codon:yes stop_codon:yes gene_type:complete
MKYIFIFIFLFTLSCSFNKVKNNHGTTSLDTKYKKLYVNKSNSNDIINIFGPPSTKSNFDEKIWFYIERKKVNRSILKLGIQKLEQNNVVVLEINNKGLLVKKQIYDLDKMNELKFTEKNTEKKYSKNSYIYGVLRSLRDKIDAPTKRKRVESKK